MFIADPVNNRILMYDHWEFQQLIPIPESYVLEVKIIMASINVGSITKIPIETPNRMKSRSPGSFTPKFSTAHFPNLFSMSLVSPCKNLAATADVASIADAINISGIRLVSMFHPGISCLGGLVPLGLSLGGVSVFRMYIWSL